MVLAGDRGEGVAHLLRRFTSAGESHSCILTYCIMPTLSHPLRYYEHDNDNTPLEMVTALLLLSTKYDFTNIRKDVIKHLSRHYPTTLAEYEALDDHANIFGRTRAACHFELLGASVTAQADILLPALYYACSSFSIGNIFEVQSLDATTLKTLLIGKGFLEHKLRLLLVAVFRDTISGRCSSDGNCRIQKNRVFPLNNIFDTTDARKFKGQKVVEVGLDNFCPICRKYYAENLDGARVGLWDLIPELFGLPKWEVLKGVA